LVESLYTTPGPANPDSRPGGATIKEREGFEGFFSFFWSRRGGVMSIATKIGNDLQGFGGHLECTVCGREQPLGDVGVKLADGWPKCCGYTMSWMTQRLLDERSLSGHNPKGQQNA
jgi:hypothetical protein